MSARHSLFVAILTGVALVAIPVHADDHPLAGTVLKELAEGMEPGTFLRLQDGPNDPALPEGFNSYSQVQMRGTFHSSAEAWSPVAEWCPELKRVYQVADRTGGNLEFDRTAISGYDATTHAWMRHKLHPRSGEEKILGAAHVYGGWALASERGKLYRPIRGRMWEYDLREETWSSREFPGMNLGAGQTPVVYHPDIGRLVAISRNGEVRAWDPEKNTVTTLPGRNPEQTGRHGQGVYNAVRKEVMLWAGDNGRQVTLVTAEGVAVAKSDAPDEVNGGARNSSLFLTYDPLSGNYLTYGGRELWEYSPDQDEWRLALTLDRDNPDRFPHYHGYLMTAIPEAGVIMWNHRASPRLYKHKSVFAEDAEE